MSDVSEPSGAAQVCNSTEYAQCKSKYLQTCATPDISLTSLPPVHLLSEAKLYKGDTSESASLEETSQPLLWGLVFETDRPVLLSNANPNSSAWNVISRGQSQWAETLQPEVFQSRYKWLLTGKIRMNLLQCEVKHN